jgi:hypothetical protein
MREPLQVFFKTNPRSTLSSCTYQVLKHNFEAKHDHALSQMPFERAFTKKPTSMTWSWDEPRQEMKRSSTESNGR